MKKNPRLKAVPGYPGYFATRDGFVWSKRKGGLIRLRPYTNRTGHQCIVFSYPGKKTTRLVHRVILETFVGPCPPKHESLHGPNGVVDNSAGNLRWGTRSENELDKARDGTSLRGENHFKAKLKEVDVKLIRIMYPRYTQTMIAKIFGVQRETVGSIVRGINWGWL